MILFPFLAFLSTALSFFFLFPRSISCLTINNYEINDLEATGSYLETEAAPWVLTNQIGSTKATLCGTTWLLGGDGVIGPLGSFERTYSSVPSHNTVFFSIRFWIIDAVASDTLFTISFNNQVVDTWVSGYVYTTIPSVLCGAIPLPDYDDIRIRGQVSHNANDIVLKIASGITGTGRYFGLREVNLLLSNTAGSTSACKFSAAIIGSRSCYCPENQFGGTNPILSCENCHSSCDSCVGSAASQCASCPDASSFDGTNCFTCHSTCYKCTGAAANNCVRCPTTSYLYWDSTCRATCDPPLVVTTDGDYKSCNKPCTGTEFVYWDGSCDPDCDLPLIQGATADGVPTCSFPCPLGEFYYPHNTDCDPLCPSPFEEDVDGDKKYCNLPCDSGEYYDWNDDCIANCDLPLIDTEVNGVKYCNLPCPLGEFKFPNATCKPACPSPFVEDITGDLRLCNFPCASNEFYDWNEDCIANCDPPLETRTEEGIEFCDLPCPLGEFQYPDASCDANCPSFFVQNINGDLRLCEFPCPSGEFLDWHGICIPDCDLPLLERTNSQGIKFCDLPCPLGEFQYPDDSCDADCPSPLFQDINGDLKLCKTPCNPGEFINWHNTCIPDCNPPLISSSPQDIDFCDLPCPLGEFQYPDASCSPNCPSPLFQDINGDLKLCKTPCNPGESIDWHDTCITPCNSPLVPSSPQGIDFCDLPCPLGEFQYPDLSCLPDCDPPFVQDITGDLRLCKTPCLSNEYLDWNNQCAPSCDPPLKRTDSQGIDFCSLPCPTGQFLNLHDICITSCSSPFTQVPVGDYIVCDSHCTGGDFLYWDGSCLTSCPVEFQTYLGSSKYYCEPHCTSNDYLYWDNSCSPSCDYPLKPSTNSNNQRICSKPCSAGSFLYQNDTCLTTCQSPYVQLVSTYVTFCNSPCSDSEYFNQTSNTCQGSCDPPATEEQSGTLRICQPGEEEEENSIPYALTVLVDALGDATFGFSIVLNFLKTGNPSSLFALSLSALLNYIQYLDIEYPKKVEDMFSLKMFELPSIENEEADTTIADAFQNKLENNPSLHIFVKREMNSAFLANYWDVTKTLFLCLLLALLTWPLEKLIKKANKPKIQAIVQKITAAVRWNLFLVLFFASFEDLALFFSLEVLTVSFHSFLDVLSFLYCIFAALLTIVVLWKLIKISRDFTKVQIHPLSPEYTEHIEKLEDKWGGYKLFFEDFKSHSIFQQGFLFLFSLRLLLCFLIVGFLHKFPIVQTVLMSILGLLMLVYIFKARPMKERSKMIELTVYEIIISITNIAVFIYAVNEGKKDSNEAIRNHFGTVIITMNFAITVASSIFPAIEVFSKIFEVLQSLRKKDKVAPEKVGEVPDEKTAELRNNQDNISPLHSPASLLDGEEKDFLPGKIPYSSPFNNKEYSVFIAKGRKKTKSRLFLGNTTGRSKRISDFFDESETDRDTFDSIGSTNLKFGQGLSKRNKFKRDTKSIFSSEVQTPQNFLSKRSPGFSNITSIYNFEEKYVQNHTLDVHSTDHSPHRSGKHFRSESRSHFFPPHTQRENDEGSPL